MASNSEKERKRLLLLEMAKARREGLLSQLQEYHQKKSGSQQLADLYSSPEYKTGLDRAYRGGMEAQIAKSDAERRAREGAVAHQQNAFQPSTQAYPDAGGMQMGRGMSQYQVQGLLADNVRSIRSREMAAQQAMAQAQAGAVAREQAGPAMSPGEQAWAMQQAQKFRGMEGTSPLQSPQLNPEAFRAVEGSLPPLSSSPLRDQAQANALAREQAGPEMSLGEDLYQKQQEGILGYRGDYDDQGRRHGQGTYTWGGLGDHLGRHPAVRYEGEFIEGRREGAGTATYSNGSYTGEFEDGERHGQGTYTWDDGERYEGTYVNGRKGTGTQYWPDGRVRRTWEDGRSTEAVAPTPTPGSTFRGMDNYALGPTLSVRDRAPRVQAGPMYPNAVPYPGASTTTLTPTPTQVQELPGESLDKFTNNYLDNVQQRKKLIRGASMLFGVPDRSAAYEAKAIAKYTTLMDSRAARMSIGSQPRTQMEMVSAYLKAGGSLEGLKALSSVVTYGGSKPEAPKQLVFTETDENGKTWKVTQRWNPKTGELKEIGRVEVKEKGPLVVLNPGITEGPYATAMGTQLAKIVTDESGEAASARDSTRKIDQMIAAVQSGGVVTGQLTPMQLSIGRFFESSGIGAAAFGKFWGPQAEQIGTSEWFQAVADELGAKKLQMTKGNVTEKEMMLFLGMGPQLSKTPQGNILLLQMMQAMNARVMATHEAANEVNNKIVGLADEGKSISGPKAYQMYEEIRKKKINDLDTDFENKAKRGGEWNPIRLSDGDVSGNELTESGRAKVEKGQYFILPDGRMGLEE